LDGERGGDLKRVRKTKNDHHRPAAKIVSQISLVNEMYQTRVKNMSNIARPQESLAATAAEATAAAKRRILDCVRALEADDVLHTNYSMFSECKRT
jgi:hypothetical protein